MSIRHIAECFYTESLRPNQRLVAIALADYADDHGRLFPSLRNIAAKTGYSRRQTQRLVQELADLGYVEIVIEATWNRTPLYQLHPEHLDRPDRSEDIPLPIHDLIADTISGQDAPERGGDKLTPPPAEGVTNGAEGVTPATPGGDTGDTLNRHGTTTEPSQTIESEPEIIDDEESPTYAEEHLALERFEETTTDIEPEPARPRNRAWDALTLVFEYEPEGSEQSLWGEISRLAHDAALNEDSTGDPGQEVLLRAHRIIDQWGAKALTPPSLKKHWKRFGSRLGAITETEEQALKDNWNREERRRKLAALEAAPTQLEGGRR